MWTFRQRTGFILDPSGKPVWKGGYAGGNEGKNPEGINNPDKQNVPKVGPLPQGLYTFDEPVPISQLGPFAIPLIPDPANEMFGRKGFYIHGDRTQPPTGRASEGCIIAPRFIRNIMWASNDHQIQVVEG